MGKQLKDALDIFVILLIMWALGLVTSYMLGGFVHILLVIALVVLAINLIQGEESGSRFSFQRKGILWIANR